MVPADRYEVIGEEWLFEPGSNNQVLKNHLGITSPEEIKISESNHLLRARNSYQDNYTSDHKFTSADILDMHKTWLGPIYPSAGRYREVNISKEGFAFASFQHIPALMKEFENKFLAKFTPLKVGSNKEVSEALAITHVELIVVHPFREGNGRTARELASLMANQSGLPPLSFDSMTGDQKPQYISAIHSGFSGDMKPMINLFEHVIDQSLSLAQNTSFENLKWHAINNTSILSHTSGAELKTKTMKLIKGLEDALNSGPLINSEKETLCVFFGSARAARLILNDRVRPDVKVAAAWISCGGELSRFPDLSKSDIGTAKDLGKMLDVNLGRDR